MLPLHDVDVHHAGANVEQGGHCVGRGIVVVLVAVLQGERVNIHDGRLAAAELQRVGVVEDLVLLDGHQQHVNGRRVQVVAQHLVVNVDVGSCRRECTARPRCATASPSSGSTMACIEIFLTITEWPLTEVATCLALNACLGEDLADGAGDAAAVHDHRIDDDVAGQRLHAEVAHHDLAAAALQLHGLDAVGADVETDDRFVGTET